MAFCKNCGTQLKEGAVFCKNCGTPVDAASAPKNESAPEFTYDHGMGVDLQKAKEITAAGAEQAKKIGAVGAEQAKKLGDEGLTQGKKFFDVYKKKFKEDRRVRIGTGVAAAVIVLLVVLIVVVVNNSKSINLEDMVTFTAEGVDSKGTAYYSIDEEAFTAAVIKARGGKINYEPNSYEWELAASGYEVYSIMNLVELSCEDGTDLSNGDTVTVNIEYDNTAAKQYGIKFKGKSAKFTVEGLEVLTPLDPFENLTVTFEGIAPNAYASLSYTGDDGYLSDYNFYTEDYEGLDKGDTVKVYAEWEDAEEYGYYLSETEKEYTCEDVATYVSSLSDIDAANLSTMQTAATDSIESYFAGKYDSVSYSSLNYEGAYLLSAKDNTGSYYTQNMLYLIYSAKVTQKSSSPSYKKKLVYLPMYFYNVVSNVDGSISYDWDEDIQGSTSLSVGWGSVPGYEKYDAMYNALVLSRKSEYLYETSDELGGQKTSADDDDDDDDDDSDYILPTSDSEYLTTADLEGLTKDELRLARNEIYARHGYIFDDDELQEYFDSKDWYSPESSDQTKIAKDFNDYELDNTDLIIQYEKDKGYR